MFKLVVDRSSSVKYLLSSIFIIILLSEKCAATIDLSNLDLNNFEFFRYQEKLPNGELRKLKPPPPSIESHIQNTKAGIKI